MNRWLIVLFLFLTSGCALWSPQSSVTVIDYPEELKDAKYYFTNKNFERAEAEVNRYMTSAKDVYWLGHAYLLLGEIREKSGQESLAVEAYKKALSHGKGYHSSTTAQALYRISWIYEREKKYEDLLITLLDLEKALGRGDNFIKHIETPARLANVHYVLNQWDRALAQRARITDEIFDRYHEQAKTPVIEFQSRLYRAFLGMEPLKTTPYKSQDILTLTQKELLSTAEVSNAEIAEKAFNGVIKEYERYFSQVKQLAPAANPIEVARRNTAKLEELAKFLDYIEELRASKRPPELVVNQDMNLQFFKALQAYEDEARALSKKLEIGIQKAKKDKNVLEPSAEPPVKKSVVPPVPQRM